MAHVADAISDRILSVLESGQVKSIAKRVVASTGDKVLPAVQDVKKNVFERSISGTARCFEFPYAVNDVVVSVKCPFPFEYKSYLIAIQAVDGEFPQLRADQDGWTPATAFSGVYRYLSNEKRGPESAYATRFYEISVCFVRSSSSPVEKCCQICRCVSFSYFSRSPTEKF